MYDFRGFDAGCTQGSLAAKNEPEDPPRLDADTAVFTVVYLIPS